MVTLVADYLHGGLIGFPIRTLKSGIFRFDEVFCASGVNELKLQSFGFWGIPWVSIGMRLTGKWFPRCWLKQVV